MEKKSLHKDKYLHDKMLCVGKCVCCACECLCTSEVFVDRTVFL